MSLLWALPVGVLAGGMAALAATASRTASAAVLLSRSCSRMNDLADELRALRGEADDLRAAIEGLGRPRSQVPPGHS